MKSTIEAIALFLGTIAIIVVLLGDPVMLLWNWLMPELFGLSEVTFWQAIGLNILCTILFRPTISVKKQD